MLKLLALPNSINNVEALCHMCCTVCHTFLSNLEDPKSLVYFCPNDHIILEFMPWRFLIVGDYTSAIDINFSFEISKPGTTVTLIHVLTS